MDEELILSKFNFLDEEINEEEVKLKIKEIDEKIKNKVELILIKEDITFDEYQILRTYELDLKNKIENMKKNESKEEYAQVLAKLFSKNF